MSVRMNDPRGMGRAPLKCDAVEVKSVNIKGIWGEEKEMLLEALSHS